MTLYTTITDNTSGAPFPGQGLGLGGQNAMQAQQYQAIAKQYQAAQLGLNGVLNETTALLHEIRDDLLDMKKWLIQTYPDIYTQYVSVKDIERST